VAVVRRGTDGPDWQLAQKAVVSELHRSCGPGIRLRLYEVCRGPRKKPVAIGAYDESVQCSTVRAGSTTTRPPAQLRGKTYLLVEESMMRSQTDEI
jgi:hypothetical protein